MDFWDYLDYLAYMIQHPKEDLWQQLEHIYERLGDLQPVDLVEILLYLFVGFSLLYIGFISGSLVENSHYRRILIREKQLLHRVAVSVGLDSLFPVDPETHIALCPKITQSQLVTGTVVLAEDYFKSLLGLLKSHFGGNLTSYESLLDRARREAILRLKENAPKADLIVNLRLYTSSIFKEGGEDSKGPKSVEVIATGTALWFEDPSEIHLNRESHDPLFT